MSEETCCDHRSVTLVAALIGVYGYMADVREAAADPAARGVRACIEHLEAYLRHLQAEPAHGDQPIVTTPAQDANPGQDACPP